MVIYSLPDFQAAFSTKLRAEKERKLLKTWLKHSSVPSGAWPQVLTGKGTLQVIEASAEGSCPVSLGPWQLLGSAVSH